MSTDRRIRVADIIGSQVITADGTDLGRVVDIAVSPAPEYRITELILGQKAWLKRWHVDLPFAEASGRAVQPRTIDWARVDRCEPPEIHLR